MPRNLSLKSLLKFYFKKSEKKIFEEEEAALSNEGTAQELRQIQVLFHTKTNDSWYMEHNLFIDNNTVVFL